MAETIKLIPTSCSLPSGAKLKNQNNAFTGIDDDTFASLIFAPSKSQDDPTSGEVEFIEFQGPNGETAADIASKIEHLNSISFKVKYRAFENTGAVNGLQLAGWGNEASYVASSEPQIADIAFNPNPMVATIDEYWQAVSGGEGEIAFVCDVTSLDTNPAVLNIYGMEMEINYEPKGEPDPSKIDPNSSAEIIFGDTGSTKTYDVEIKDLAVGDGLLNGTAVGIAQKSFTGRVDQIKFAFNDVPFDGVGGGSGSSNVEVVNIECDLQAATVTSCDKTFAELEAAVNAGKPVIGFLHSTGLIKNSRPGPVLMTLIPNPFGELKAFVGDMNNFIYPGSGSIMNLDMVSLVWESTDELPTLSHHVFKIMLQPNE